jgi:hypothetical protein
MTPSEQSLLALFDEVLGLPPDAADWLLSVWAVTQVFDDVADGHNVERKTLHDAIWNSLVKMPMNPFYQTNSGTLLPIMANSILKWVASDDAERAGKADERSFVWRAAFYDIVLLVVLLTQGKDAALAKAATVMSLYGETFEDYRKEFPLCPNP